MVADIVTISEISVIFYLALKVVAVAVRSRLLKAESVGANSTAMIEERWRLVGEFEVKIMESGQ